jgi:hypothetical protein
MTRDTHMAWEGGLFLSSTKKAKQSVSRMVQFTVGEITATEYVSHGNREAAVGVFFLFIPSL